MQYIRFTEYLILSSSTVPLYCQFAAVSFMQLKLETLQYLPYINSALFLSGCNTTSSIEAEFNTSFSISSTRLSRSPPNQMYCYWRITAPPDAHITIQVIDYSLDGRFAFVFFGYGHEITIDTLLSRFGDGQLGPARLAFENNTIWILFKDEQMTSDLHIVIQAVLSEGKFKYV